MAKELPPDWRVATRFDIPVAQRNSGLEILPYLVVLHGSDLGRRIAIRGQSVTLGRADAAEVRIYDERISSLHCKLNMGSEGLMVEDLNSRNGTYIDEQKITRAPLLPHSQLRIGRTVMRVEFRTEAEIKLQEDIFVQATTDPLTHAPNRRWFTERAEAEVAYANRSEVPLCMVMLDVDHFKAVNDTHGHQAGDFVLVKLAQFMMEKKRHEDLFCRFGGEEFLFMIRLIPVQSAAVFCERIRHAISKTTFTFDKANIPITISMGIAVFKKGDTLVNLIGRADTALYQAKQLGRNRVEIEAAAGGSAESKSSTLA